MVWKRIMRYDLTFNFNISGQKTIKMFKKIVNLKRSVCGAPQLNGLRSLVTIRHLKCF